jgi:SAM-dependent methyltransferase
MICYSMPWDKPMEIAHVRNTMEGIDPNRPLKPEVRNGVSMRIANGFFAKYLSGARILDVGFSGGDATNQPIVPWAVGVDSGFPGYDGSTLPFDGQSQDAVHSSYVLDRVPNPRALLAEWFRVLRIGGYLIATVPYHVSHEHLLAPVGQSHVNEKRRFYTVHSLLKEVRGALPADEIRYCVLHDIDVECQHTPSAAESPTGLQEIEMVLERVGTDDANRILSAGVR